MSNGRRGQQMEQRIVILLEGVANIGDPIVNKSEVTDANEEGFVEATVMRLRYAGGCGHTLRTAQEIGGCCSVCGALLCSACSREAMCAVCGRCACRACRRLVSLRGEEQIVCRSCRWRVWLYDPWDTIRWVAVAIFALLLLAALL